MVSLRRRKLLALRNGRTYTSLDNQNSEDGISIVDGSNQNIKSNSHPGAPVDSSKVKQEQASITETDPGSANATGSSSSKEEPTQQYQVPEFKRRKRHRRKQVEDREPCIMRGVYYKNMKWQAAIKVDKKQIHLGTVGSQEEAARLYDRAAFMRGREPNFELSEEEKEELRRFKWDEFMEMTRNTINTKKHQRRISSVTGKSSEEQLIDRD